MSPNCRNCDQGWHLMCSHDHCECDVRGHQDVAVETGLREGQCTAALNISGEHYSCDLDANHHGLAHSSVAGEAIWSPVPGPQTSPPPAYMLLDLFMALGGDSQDFDEQRPVADYWAYLLDQVRQMNYRGIERHAKTNGDPLYLRAKAAVESLCEVASVTIDMVPRDTLAYTRGNGLDATITITGPVD